MAGLSAQLELSGVSGLTALGGLAGIGGGIYAALTAGTIPGQIGGALGAASGGVALAAGLGLLGPLSAVFGPIGLALSALLPILGGILGGLGAPKGPRFNLAPLTGGTITASGGQLAFAGDVTTSVARAERIPGGADTEQIASALQSTTNQLIGAMVATINAVAIDPEALLGPAQQALESALNDALIVNSSNKKNFQADIEAQLKFIPQQIASFFLDPLLQAFNQLDAADLDTKIQRLSPSVGALAAVFAEMSKQLDELADVANSDVRRNIAEVQGRVTAFGEALVREANELSQGIVDAVIETSQQTLDEVMQQSLEVQRLSIPGLFQQRFEAAAALQGAASQLGAAGLDYSGIQAQLEELFTSVIQDATALMANALTTGPFPDALATILSIPQAVTALNPALQEIQALAAKFALVVAPLTQDIARLEAALRTPQETIDLTAERIADLTQAIADAGDQIEVALPLYDELRQAILAQADAQAQLIQDLDQQLQQIESQQDQITDLISDTASPTQQQAELEAQIAALAPAALAGTATPEQMQELIDLNAQLLALGEQTDNLALQQEAIDNLTVVSQLLEQQQALLEDQLVAVAGTTDADAALQAVQEQALAELQALNDQLEALYLGQEAVQQSLQLPVPVVVTGTTAQTGGLMKLAGGGYVPAMLEPQEAVYFPPMTPGQQQALSAMNSAFPRFAGGGRIVPGLRSGDTVPALLPSGSFVLNRSAVKALRGSGFQAGGTISGGTTSNTLNVGPIHVHVNGSNTNAQEIGRQVALEVRRTLERINMSSFGPPKVR